MRVIKICKRPWKLWVEQVSGGCAEMTQWRNEGPGFFWGSSWSINDENRKLISLPPPLHLTSLSNCPHHTLILMTPNQLVFKVNNLTKVMHPAIPQIPAELNAVHSPQWKLPENWAIKYYCISSWFRSCTLIRNSIFSDALQIFSVFMSLMM